MKLACDLFLLDLGNVLVKFDHTILARKLSKLSRKPVFSVVSKFIRSGWGELFDEGKISPEDFTQQVLQDLSLRITPDEFKAIWNDIFTENPGMAELVLRIKERYPLFVISDTNVLHFEFVRSHFSILNHVDRFILSYQVGVRKPHPKLFQEALHHAKTTAERTLFADDRKEIVDAALRMGFQAFQFTGAKSFKKELQRLNLLS